MQRAEIASSSRWSRLLIFNGAIFMGLSGSLAAPAAAQQAPAASGAEKQSAAARAATLFQRGNELYINERWAEAEAAYQEAWELRKAYDIAAHLGHTELRLGKPREAAAHLSYALRSWPTMANPKQREMAEKRLAEARREVGALELRVSTAGAEVSVDGRPVGVAPIAHEIFVDPGEHTVSATLEGYEPASRRVVTAKGAKSEVELPLRPIPVKTSTPEPRKSKPLLIIGTGLSVALLGTGTGFFVASQVRKADFESAREAELSLGGGIVTCKAAGEAGPPKGCADMKDAMSENHLFLTIGTPLLAVGAAAGVATLVYALWPSSKPEPRSGLRVQPVITASDGGVRITGLF